MCIIQLHIQAYCALGYSAVTLNVFVFICMYLLISPDSVYVAAEVQTATHQTNSFLRSEPMFLNTEKKEREIQLSISAVFAAIWTETLRCF